MRSNSRASLLAIAIISGLIGGPAACAQASAAQAAAQTAAPAATEDAIIIGKVTSFTGQPVERADVLIVSLSVAVTTDVQGNYRIVIPAAQAKGQLVRMDIRARSHRDTTASIRITPGTQTRRITLPGYTFRRSAY